MPGAWLGAFGRKVGKSRGFGAPGVGFGSLLGAGLLLRAASKALWIDGAIVTLIFIQSCVSTARWSSALHVPVLSSGLLVLLLSLKLTDPACYPSHPQAAAAAAAEDLLWLWPVPAVDHGEPAVVARQKGGAWHGPFQQRAVGGSQGHCGVSCGGGRPGKHGGVGRSLLLVVLLLLLLHHGDGCAVVDRGGNKVLLGGGRHAGHRVVLRQRAFVSTLDRLVFNLTAAVHALCGQTKEEGSEEQKEPR